MMTGIGTSIELYDRVSAPIYKMIASIGNLVGAMESMDSAMDGGFDASKIEAARSDIERAALEVIQLGDEIDENGRSQDNFNKKVRQGGSDMDALTNKVMGMVGAYASLQGVKKLIDLSDEYTRTTARLSLIVDKQNDVKGLQDKIFASAQRSRSSYADTADLVAKISMRTGKMFTNDEAIVFAENLNKLYKISGASQEEMRSSQLQLTQALGSGVLRGEEFNAVFEAAPNVMQAVADYMDVPIGKLREMAADGEITASIVKNAMLKIPKETLDAFDQIPMTWSDVWTGVMNKLYYASQPILEVISLLAQHWSILEPFVIGAAVAVGIYAAALGVAKAIQIASMVTTAIHTAFTSGWTVATFAATVAQQGLNAALLTCPLTWILLIIIAVIAAIYAIVAAINHVTGSTLSATGIIVGALMAVVAFIWNLFLSLLDLVLGIINIFVNQWVRFANFFGNLFNDPIGAIIRLFGDMADSVLGILETIAKAIDKIFGSDLASAVQGWRSGLDSMIEGAVSEYGNGSYEDVMSEINLSSESLGLGRWEYGDAYNKGYGWGEGIGNSVSGMFGGGLEGLGGDLGGLGGLGGGGYDAGQVPSNIADTASNTGKAADSLDITSEDLKYLKDIAETEVINRFTTAEIKVDMTNNNTVNSGMDIDGIVDSLATGVNEAMEKAAEGVHS